MVVTLCAVLNPEMCLLHTVVWGMISWGRIQKKGMIIYYQCECTLYAQLLRSPNQSILSQFLTQSAPASHLPLTVALAFQFAFGLRHLPLIEMRSFYSLFLVFPLEWYSCRSEII